MKELFRRSLLAVALLAAAGCQGETPPSQSADAPPPSAAKQFQKVRGSAVAGLFYPKSEQELKRTVDRLLADAKSEPVKNLRALICPHAGYEYSGPIAAVGYKQLADRHFSTVILLGPSHYALYSGAFVSSADAYQTPLGMIPIGPKAAKMAQIEPFSANPRCRVERPGWWRQSPLELPPDSEDTPETWEHSLEVQLPFLQCTLHDFNLVPVVLGQVDPKQVAEKLIPFLDDQTLVVVSTDLSHYHPYDDAKTLDTHTVNAICELRDDLLQDEDACGHTGVQVLIEIARQKGWKPQLLDYRNSGDTSGDKSQVVGYAAVAFSGVDGPAPLPMSDASQFTPEERNFLLKLARDSVAAVVTGGKGPKEDADVPAKFRARQACFVTLTENDELRGCIGSIFPEESLYQAVIRRAKSAAIEDPRFSPVRSNELKRIEIEVSVLTVPKPLAFNSPEDLLAKLRPNVDGVVLDVEGRKATFLPQVWEKLPDKRLFMSQLSQKAGLPANAWTQPGASVMTYQVEAFKEEGEMKGGEKR